MVIGMRAAKNILCLMFVIVLACALAGGAGAAGLTSAEISEGQKNIVKRAHQMYEVEWSPIYDRYQWAYEGVFYSGTTYSGVPYGQPVNAAYVGIDCTFTDFLLAVNDNTSLFYSRYSTYNRIAPYYSSDCSGLVSYAWGLPERKTTRYLPEVSVLVPNQSLGSIEVGDILNNISTHVILITDVRYDELGEIAAIEVIEQTPVIMRKTVYGTGGMLTLRYFENYYFGSGYKLYRYDGRDDVTYTHDCAAPVDGDYCEDCRQCAPYVYVSYQPGSKTVQLSHRDKSAAIYYTTDGSEPTRDDELYSGPLVFYDTAQLKAVAITDDYDDGWVLNFLVSVDPVAAPTFSIKSGMNEGTTVSAGSTIALATSTPNATIYYTTDGSKPGSGSLVYTAPITIREDTVITAIAMADGCTDSEIVSFPFTLGVFTSFSDVSTGDWFCEAVNYVSSVGLFNGTGGDSFSPNQTMTRGMFITVMGRMAGLNDGMSGRIGIVTGNAVNIRSGPGTDNPKVGSADKGAIGEVLGEENGWYRVTVGGVTGYIISDYFSSYDGFYSDLDESKYYSAYVQWAYLTGIAAGYEDGTFRAEESITREDMAQLLYSYAKTETLQVLQTAVMESFSDDLSISGGKKDAVYALQQAQVINGMGDGSFRPQGNATRAQVATIFMRFMYAVS